MKYGIIANPAAGTLNIDSKRKALRKVSEILRDCVIVGLDTQSREEFCHCAKELSQKVDVLVAAGGDGTFSDVVNSVDSFITLSYLPLGSGNLLKYSLNFPRKITKVAEQIRDGNEHMLDLIACRDRKALTASVGLEGHILSKIEKNLQNSAKGFCAYAIATVKSAFFEYENFNARVKVDGELFDFPKTLSVIVSKVPYYGYGLKVVPKAKTDDGFLHMSVANSGKLGIAYGLATSFLWENKIGEYKSGKNISIETNRELYFQADGELYGKGKNFEFQILPGKLRMRY